MIRQMMRRPGDDHQIYGDMHSHMHHISRPRELSGTAICVHAAVHSQASRFQAASGEILSVRTTGWGVVARLNAECLKLSNTAGPFAVVAFVGELVIGASLLLINHWGVALQSSTVEAGTLVLCFVAFSGAINTAVALTKLHTASREMIEGVSMLTTGDDDSKGGTVDGIDQSLARELQLSMRQMSTIQAVSQQNQGQGMG